MSRILLLRLAAMGAVSGVVTLAHAQLLTHRDSPMRWPRPSRKPRSTATGQGLRDLRVGSTPASIVAMRADNAGPHTMENARRKAYTARSFRTDDRHAKRFADNVRWCATRLLPNVIAIPGVCRSNGDEVIAVSVSGSPGVDEPCVQDGSKVADQLKWAPCDARQELEDGDCLVSIRNSGCANAVTATKVLAGIFLFLPKNSSRIGPYSARWRMSVR